MASALPPSVPKQSQQQPQQPQQPQQQQQHVPTQYANVGSVNSSMIETPRVYNSVPRNSMKIPSNELNSSESSNNLTARQYAVFPRNSSSESMIEQQQQTTTTTESHPTQQQYQSVPADLRSYVEPNMQPKNQYASVMTRKEDH